jgi:hypothetical protein
MTKHKDATKCKPTKSCKETKHCKVTKDGQTIPGCKNLTCSTACSFNEDKPSPAGVVCLTQKDFISGTYRIKRSGIYRLAEDIVFNPSPELSALRPDLPPAGAWIAAISIEVNDVIIDGQGHKIRLSEDWVRNIHNAPVGFSIILLGNTLLPPSVRGLLVEFQTIAKIGFQQLFAFGGETDFIIPNNVTIQNTTIENSSHFGVSGNGERDIVIQDCIGFDNQVAFAFLGGTSVTVRRCRILGRVSPQVVSSRNAQLTSFPATLAHMVQQGINPEQSFRLLQEFQEYINEHPNSVNLVPLMEVPTYGIRLHAFSASSAPPSSTVLIEDCVISDIISAPRCVPTLGALCANTSISLPPPLNSFITGAVPIRDAGGFGLLEWSDFYPNGVYDPNVVARSGIWFMSNNATGELPQDFIDSVLCTEIPPAEREPTFLKYARPLLNHIGEFLQEGTFGIRIDTAFSIQIRRCTISNIQNHGTPILPLQTNPPDYYPPAHFPVTNSNIANLYNYNPYRGNDAWGIKIEGTRNAIVEDCYISNITSDHGNSFALALPTAFNQTFVESSGNISRNNIVSGVSTLWENLRPSTDATQFVSPSGSAVAYLSTTISYQTIIDAPPLLKALAVGGPGITPGGNRSASTNYFTNCTALQITSPRRAFGILLDNFDDAEAVGCTIGQVQAISTNELFDPCNPKQAIGIDINMIFTPFVLLAQLSNIMGTEVPFGPPTPFYERGSRAIANNIHNIKSIDYDLADTTTLTQVIEKIVAGSQPQAITAGIRLQLTQGAIVKRNKINDVDGGVSNAFGIMLFGSDQAIVKKNKISDVNNIFPIGGLSIPFALQVGIKDFATSSTSLFMKNFVSNCGRNVLPSPPAPFPLGGNYQITPAPPTLEFTYQSFAGVTEATKYYNISVTGPANPNTILNSGAAIFPYPTPSIPIPSCSDFPVPVYNPIFACTGYASTGCAQKAPIGCSLVPNS